MGTRERTSHLHSVTLDTEACRGCTNCIKRCPTEAIRVRNRQAVITESRCVDCGECIRHCPYRAKKALVDHLDSLNHFTWRVALPAPSLYGQFEEHHSIADIHQAFLRIGFQEVVDVFHGAALAAGATRNFLETRDHPRPVISSSCPAVVRLVMIRFPSLIDHLAPILAPMEIAARGVRKNALARRTAAGGASGSPSRTGPEREGIFFISPCAGKMTDLHDPVGMDESSVDGVLAFKDIYLALRAALPEVPQEMRESRIYNPVKASVAAKGPAQAGLAWGRVDGEGASIAIHNRISVDGIEHVIKILEMAENGSLEGIEFIEAMACPAGCVGGPLTVENPFIARVRLLNREMMEKDLPSPLPEIEPGDMVWSRRPRPRPGLHLADTMEEAMRREAELEELVKTLPGLDCGSCGSPNCHAMAEDVVCHKASVEDCMIRLKEQLGKNPEITGN